MRLILLLTLILVSSCSKDLTYFSQTEKSEIKLCILGDTGQGNPLQKLIAKKLGEEKCDSIHFVGDIVYENGIKNSEDPQLKEKFLDIYLPLTIKDNKPKLHLIMGNHDYKGSISAWYEVAQQERGVFFPHSYYLLKNRGLCMVHLDTNVFDLFYEWGEALEEIFWLNSLKDELEECKIKIALAHHPFKVSGQALAPTSSAIKLFLETYIIGNYNYLISGHEHRLSDEGIMNNTRLLITGAGGKPNDNEAAGFLVLTANLKTGKTSYTFKKVTR